MRAAHEREFITHDGSPLFYRYWPPLDASRPARGAVVLLHRGHEHSGRLQHVVDELALDDFALFAWDARGHGRSPGVRGDSPSLGASVKDIDTFVRHIASAHAIDPADLVMLGQSVGAVLAATWAHDYAPPIRGLVLTAPAFKVKLYVPLARPGLALLQRLRGNFFITSYVKAKFLTHDPQRVRSYDTDPLITRSISARVLLGLFDAAERVIADARAIRLPTQLLISGSDWVVHRAPQEAFFDALGSPIKERHLLPGFLHDTLGERDRRVALDKIRAFIERLFVNPPAADSLRQAHHYGYTADEERRLREPLPPLSLRQIHFAATRWAMRRLGRLAEGIRIGLDTGFDSGDSLDYVYRNQARGQLGIGRLIDRNYLDAIGWRGIRVRRQHLVRAIVAAARALHGTDGLRLVDIAAGQGRYVLDALAQLPEPPRSVLLRDFNERTVAQGRTLAAEQGLSDRVRFEIGDAFDEEGLAALNPRPNLAIVSGLYELFADNDRVERSLRGLGRAVASGGYLIYTGQPWHPQIELIARTLTSHRGQQAWVMRRRTQGELDELVRGAGFEKIEQWIDEWGIFTVSLARRR
ncbi:MAG TPA: bifunctional alpha/beta hydrolase/class I SAM-dependent methyltransferase [Accumulibacter sp.]|nr:bifunctional alpha/beta hydrolase/class I SAM-dependent methyltransferase [Accumulibacter sp.]HQC81519.1 bifunctional alpha/beta hydrolase/class I SAM-dependent methyltransferase [Accumulibacter sp.]